ncbi:MAG: glycosyl hydrolase family 8 [Bifidobacterium sp.]|nr:glycosyl hydrolase family 8 [Bifidobacterium sp.]
MKRVKFRWAIAVLVVVVYVVVMWFVRASSLPSAQRTQYRQWRENYVVWENKQRAFVNTSVDKTNPVALSEGQGYGLYITALAGSHDWAQQKDFDGLLNYYLAHRDAVGDRRDVPTYLMRWRQYRSGQRWVSEDNSATDGDLYIAFGLHQAAKVWPQRSSYYGTIERRLTADILRYEYNDATQALTVGDWANEGSPFHTLMRTSDVIPAFFDAFYDFTRDGRWLTVKNVMLNRMVELSNEHDTGLVPDFAWLAEGHARAVQGKTVASQYDGDYSSNACRVPMVLASSGDPRAERVSRRLLRFFERQDVITAGYSLAGRRLNSYQSNSFLAPLVYAASRGQRGSYGRILANKQRILMQSPRATGYYDATLTTMAAMEGIH